METCHFRIQLKTASHVRQLLQDPFRNLRKSRLYAFINILSLGIGMAAIIWGYKTIGIYQF